MSNSGFIFSLIAWIKILSWIALSNYYWDKPSVRLSSFIGLIYSISMPFPLPLIGALGIEILISYWRVGVTITSKMFVTNFKVCNPSSLSIGEPSSIWKMRGWGIIISFGWVARKTSNLSWVLILASWIIFFTKAMSVNGHVSHFAFFS